MFVVLIATPSKHILEISKEGVRCGSVFVRSAIFRFERKRERQKLVRVAGGFGNEFCGEEPQKGNRVRPRKRTQFQNAFPSKALGAGMNTFRRGYTKGKPCQLSQIFKSTA